MSQDPFTQPKRRQHEMWGSFGTTALYTTPVAIHVVRFAGIVAGIQRTRGQRRRDRAHAPDSERNSA